MKARAERVGPNEIKAKAALSPFWCLGLQFRQPLIVILLVAGVIKVALNAWVNVGVRIALDLSGLIQALSYRDAEAS